MFSIQLHLNRDSFLGRRPSLIQHLVALAHVQAIRGDTAREDVDIRIKWPNDVYYGSGVKLGKQPNYIHCLLICQILKVTSYWIQICILVYWLLIGYLVDLLARVS